MSYVWAVVATVWAFSSWKIAYGCGLIAVCLAIKECAAELRKGAK